MLKQLKAPINNMITELNLAFHKAILRGFCDGVIRSSAGRCFVNLMIDYDFQINSCTNVHLFECVALQI